MHCYKTASFSWLELHASYDRRIYMAQTRIAVAFIKVTLCVITCTTCKLKVLLGRFTYHTNALLSETYPRNSKSTGYMRTFYVSNTAVLSKMPIFCVIAWCEIYTNGELYASIHASQSLSVKPFLHIQCTWTHNLKTSDNMFSTSNDCYVIKDILYVV